MKWSWKLGTVAGIGIFVHWTFLILIGWIVLGDVVAGLQHQHSPNRIAAEAAEGALFIIAIFACIVLHELGHALTAQRYGVRTQDITLLPIGGVARLERMPEDPVQEFWIAVAGPAVNVAIAAIIFATLLLLGVDLTSLSMTDITVDIFHRLPEFLARIMIVNLWLVLFNAIPAFPMDGGRVLRAVLAHFSGDYVRATQVAASIGQLLAIGFGFLGLFSNPFLVFIALFVYLGAQEEAHLVQMRSLIKGLPVRAAMMTRFRALSPDDSLAVATSELLAGAQQDFPVVNDGQVVGVLRRGDVIATLAEGFTEGRVGDVMETDCGAVEDTEMLASTFQRMREGGCSALPVVHGGRLVGMVTLENVGELMMINSALRRGQGQSKVGDPSV